MTEAAPTRIDPEKTALSLEFKHNRPLEKTKRKTLCRRLIARPISSHLTTFGERFAIVIGIRIWKAWTGRLQKRSFDRKCRLPEPNRKPARAEMVTKKEISGVVSVR